ncbi:MAG TPA: gamma carbonic anhydrase family protein [Chloroflexota bacterium]|nr:gamma carbonic anhydrase family protein [Chloroflexota bacterium]
MLTVDHPGLHGHHGARPEVHPLAWVAPGAHLIGDVFVAEGASIWFGAVLRGDVNSITVGRFSNIQDNSVLHADGPRGGGVGFPCRIGEYVTVGHAAIVHGCTVADRVLIGMGAVVMNGARVGRECIVGARALVSEGREVPDHSLVLGIPGKVVREITPQELQQLGRSANHYAELARSYREE